MLRIADTGLLAAALDRDDVHHSWAASELQAATAPFVTCEPVLVELAFVLNDATAGLRMLVRGDLLLSFDLASHKDRVLQLLEKYSDRQMDLADACIVAMTEMEDRCQVWTTDETDFRVYRRHSRQVIPCSFPP